MKRFFAIAFIFVLTSLCSNCVTTQSASSGIEFPKGIRLITTRNGVAQYRSRKPLRNLLKFDYYLYPVITAKFSNNYLLDEEFEDRKTIRYKGQADLTMTLEEGVTTDSREGYIYIDKSAFQVGQLAAVEDFRFVVFLNSVFSSEVGKAINFVKSKQPSSGGGTFGNVIASSIYQYDIAGGSQTITFQGMDNIHYVTVFSSKPSGDAFQFKYLDIPEPIQQSSSSPITTSSFE